MGMHGGDEVAKALRMQVVSTHKKAHTAYENADPITTVQVRRGPIANHPHPVNDNDNVNGQLCPHRIHLSTRLLVRKKRGGWGWVWYG
ncbi:hypothetical protein S83_015777 [Arachis hypogaea]